MSEFSQVRSFNLGVAQEVSIEGALIYDDLIYAQKNFGDRWFYRSYEQMKFRFPMLSEQTLRRHIKRLVDAGWIRTKVMKVDGTPVCHYQIGRFLSTKLADSKETTKMADSINNNTKTTKSSDSSFGGSPSSANARATALLPRLVAIVNPKEKPTADRIRVLNGRLKDYTDEEIIGAANAFSQSEWHRENKQMSIDNLIAPSKFGRWYTQRTEDTVAPQTEMTQAEKDAKLAAEKKPDAPKWDMPNAPK